MIQRYILDEIKSHLNQPEMTFISGARQVGKTTLMNLLMADLVKTGRRVISLSLDFENDEVFFSSQARLIERIRLEFGDEPGYVFLDEIQRKENAGIFLKGLFDMKLPWKFVISGSGSIELKEKIYESLSGRKRIFEVYPVTFHEFLDFRTGYKYSKRVKDFVNLNTQKSLEFLNEYLNFGGYPRVITSQTIREKILTINEIFQSYIDRDIRQVIKGDQPEAFKRLIRLLAAQTGQMINLSNLSNEVQQSSPTIQKNLWLAQKTYFIRLIEPFFNNPAKEITKSPVLYFSDHGMRNFAISSFGNIQNRQDYGFAFQNLVGNTLLQKLYGTPFTLHYWRTTDKAEVDFVISRQRDPIPVEVKFSNLNKPAVTRSQRSFIEKYHPSEAWVVNLTYSNLTEIGSTNIRFIRFFDLPVVLDDLVSSIEKVFLVEESRFPYGLQGRKKNGEKRKTKSEIQHRTSP